MENQVLRIRGGKTLSGDVAIPGAKNAALKQIAAALLTADPVQLTNVPDITDVRRMLEIVEELGASVAADWNAHTVTITAGDINPDRLSEEAVRSLRASIVLLGPLLARCGSVAMPYPGGDKIGARPITAHLSALQQLGAEVERRQHHLYAKAPKGGLRSGRIVMPALSVTGTEVALMAAAGIGGVSEVRVATVEPHVRDLAAMLSAMGAKTELLEPNVYRVEGRDALSGTTHAVIPDLLDAFTFLMAGVVTRGEVTTEGVSRTQADLAFAKLEEMGALLAYDGDRISTQSKSGTLQAVTLQTSIYPGVATDLQPLFALLATQAEGVSLIHDTIFENRFRYLEELNRMGADTRMLDPHQAHIKGPTALTGIPITTFDIRAGAVLILAGLVAEGETTIHEISHIDRGYQDIDGRLRALGAEIERIPAEG